MATATIDMFTWPTRPRSLLVAYLKERASGVPDAPHQGHPFITEAGILWVKPSDWVDWLRKQRIDASSPLRSMRSRTRRWCRRSTSSRSSTATPLERASGSTPGRRHQARRSCHPRRRAQDARGREECASEWDDDT